jgi:hypothetical protein
MKESCGMWSRLYITAILETDSRNGLSESKKPSKRLENGFPVAYQLAHPNARFSQARKLSDKCSVVNKRLEAGGTRIAVLNGSGDDAGLGILRGFQTVGDAVFSAGNLTACSLCASPCYLSGGLGVLREALLNLDRQYL